VLHGADRGLAAVAVTGASGYGEVSCPPFLKFIIKDSPCFIGLNKNEPRLLARLNEIIAKAKASGELGKLSEKWLKALPRGQWEPQDLR
jgi:ABC-type amino acid transport substrate-binding protein